MADKVEGDFRDADYILLQGGPKDTTAEKDRFRTFEKILGELESQPDIIMPLDLEMGSIEEAASIENFDELVEYVKNNKEYDVPTYLERIGRSSSIDGENFDYTFIEPKNTFDEAKWAFKLLDGDEKIIFITSEYHLPRTELILKFLLNPGSYQVIGSEFTGSPFKRLLLKTGEIYKRAVMKLFYIIY